MPCAERGERRRGVSNSSAIKMEGARRAERERERERERNRGIDTAGKGKALVDPVTRRYKSGGGGGGGGKLFAAEEGPTALSGLCSVLAKRYAGLPPNQ
jgi:hypothetical protein